MEDLDGGQHLRDMAADARIAPTAVDVCLEFAPKVLGRFVSLSTK